MAQTVSTHRQAGRGSEDIWVNILQIVSYMGCHIKKKQGGRPNRMILENAGVGVV